MRMHDLARYGLWLGVAATARANRRHYRMPTTWAPHLALNTAALLLPDLLRAAGAGGSGTQAGGWRALRSALRAVACESPGYVLHIAPFAVGYLTSHPQLDIYKGELGELRLAGFGLDALPHAATAMGLVLLIADMLPAAAAAVPPGRFGDALRRAAARPLLAGGATLAVLTVAWELGEYMALRYELRVTGGDLGRINMQWSVSDTLRDCAANAAGWALAYILRAHAGGEPGRGSA